MRIIFLLFLSFSLINCQSERKKENKISLINLSKLEKVQKIELEENFTDSTEIGLKRKFKINLKKYRSPDSVYVEINLYKKAVTNWIKVQRFEFLKDGVLSCDPKIEDFNNDGFNDFTFQSSIAGRGANTIRKLFIFDKEKLKFIKNSENFPNIRYNKELNCIDAFRVYAGSQTAFAKIEKDSLREFANVEIYDDTLKVKYISKNGKEKLLKIEKYENGYFHRFKNYKPLIEDVEYNK